MVFGPNGVWITLCLVGAPFDEGALETELLEPLDEAAGMTTWGGGADGAVVRV